eukprot:1968831-Ditylum_brightwellii.AAC.1
MSDTNVTQGTANNGNEKEGKEADNMTENKRTFMEEVDSRNRMSENTPILGSLLGANAEQKLLGLGKEKNGRE